MKLRNNNTSTIRIYRPWMADEVDDVVDDLPGNRRGVVFDGEVEVSESVGDRLTEYESIYSTDKNDDNGDNNDG